MTTNDTVTYTPTAEKFYVAVSDPSTAGRYGPDVAADTSDTIRAAHQEGDGTVGEGSCFWRAVG